MSQQTEPPPLSPSRDELQQAVSVEVVRSGMVVGAVLGAWWVVTNPVMAASWVMEPARIALNFTVFMFTGGSGSEPTLGVMWLVVPFAVYLFGKMLTVGPRP